MALLLNNAILHIVNNAGSGSSFSNQELDVDSETTYEFVSRHVRRLIRNPEAKEATFSAESSVYPLVKAYQKGEMHFKDMSLQLCEKLSDIMHTNKAIPPADILIASFDYAKKTYLAILKLNYGECFTHRIVESDGGLETQIIKNTVVLPLSGSKVDEACLIPYDPMILRILEKPHSVGGEDVFYFSKLFLGCETEMSSKETLTIIQDIAEEINAKYFDEDIEVAAKVKCALIDEVNESGEESVLNVQNAVNRVFHDKEEVTKEFIARTEEYHIPYEVKMDKALVQRSFKTQSFKADNGIEIKFPSELYNEPDVIQFTNNSDGTVSIHLKNLRRNPTL